MDNTFDRITLLGFVLVAFAALLSGGPWAARTAAQSPDAHPYFHLAERCTVGPKNGFRVVDMRNGNMWCLATDNSAPKYEGTLYLLGIPEQAPKASR